MPFENRQHLKPGMLREAGKPLRPATLCNYFWSLGLRDWASDFMIENVEI